MILNVFCRSDAQRVVAHVMQCVALIKIAALEDCALISRRAAFLVFLLASFSTLPTDRLPLGETAAIRILIIICVHE